MDERHQGPFETWGQMMDKLMDEHVHEWKRQSDGKYWRGNGHTMLAEVMSNDEVERRLNATERLGALQAKELMVFAMGSTRIAQPELIKALRAYANILEGK